MLNIIFWLAPIYLLLGIITRVSELIRFFLEKPDVRYKKSNKKKLVE